MRLVELRTDLLILSCAISAGIHGALVRGHFEEGTGAGLGFAVAAVLLAVLAVGMTRNPTPFVVFAAAATLAGLIASYALAITTGFPVLHPEPEPIDSLALSTKTIEAVGLGLAAGLLRRPALAISLTQPKGTTT
jgi:hypothetical protein